MREPHDEGMHERFREKLIGYLYEEMLSRDRADFEAHLQECPICRCDVEEFRRVRHELGEWQLQEIPRITIQLQPNWSQSFRQLFRAMPIWMKAASFAAAAMLLIAIVNLRISLGGSSGFQIHAGLWPSTTATSSANPSGLLTEQQVQSLIQAAVRQEQDRHQAEMNVRLAELADRLKAERDRELVQLAEAVRREQRQQLRTVWNEMDRRIRPTFASLFMDSDAGAND